jgi:transcriptional regulator with XRE-family HTH domain
MDTEVFVQNVKAYCALKGVKPTIACAESGAGKSLISEVTNRGRVPSVERIQLLAQYLGCTVSDLLGETPGALPSVPEGPTEQFLKLFSSLDDKAQNEIVAEMLKRKK